MPRYLSVASTALLYLAGSPLVHGYGPPLGDYFGISGTDETFNYIVVGGGTAGLAVASRLAEDASKSVAVIEGGGFYEV